MNAPGVSKFSPAQPTRGVSIPLVNGLGEVTVDRLEDGTVRIKDIAADLPPYVLEFSTEEWDTIVKGVSDGIE